MQTSDTKILVCCHKPANIPENGIFMPIHCGKALSGLDLGMAGDDTGDNISRKNPNYCELTAIYWAWKNLSGTEYIGLYHYRRYFLFNFWKDIDMKLFHKRETIIVHDWEKSRITSSGIKRILRRYDIILSRQKHFNVNLRQQYIDYHRHEDIDLTRDAIKALYPEYLDSFDYIMEKTYGMSLCNMFISKWDLFDRYCTWLFSILSYVEQRISIPEDPYQSRVFGFLSERLLNVFCHHNNLKIKHKYICMVEERK